MNQVIAIFVLCVLLPAAHANVVGADTQNFNPTNDGLDFVTVHSSETLTPGLINLGVFLNYAVNTLPNYEDTATQSRLDFRDSLLSSDLNFAVGLRPGWEVGASMPIMLRQSVEDTNAFRGEFAQDGVTEFRVMTKLRLLGDHDGGLATVLSMNFNQIGDNPFLGSGAGPTMNLELAGDQTFGLFAVGANVGYRFRQPGDRLAGVPIEPFGNELIASGAVSYLLTSFDTKLIGEIFGSVPTQTQQFISDRDASSAELLVGAKTDLTPSLAFHVGGGTELLHGASSPDWRVYTGLNWVIGPLFSEPREVVVKVKEQPLKALEDLEPASPFDQQPQVRESFIARDVLFEFNSDRLQPGAHAVLKRLADYLRKPPGFRALTVEGHTDSVGSALYNLDLSQRRAERVRVELISMGLNGSRIRALGFGESRPIADNGNFQGRAVNRRVEFKVERE